MIGNKYIFKITFQGTTTQVNPINDDFTIEWTRENDAIFFRQAVSTQFLFCKDDFDLLYAIEQSCDRCELVKFDIVRKCSTGDFVAFTGYFNMNEGDWNEQNCSVSISPSPFDSYTCLFDNWQTEKNIISGTAKVTVEPFIGIIECQTVTKAPIPPLVPFILSAIPNADFPTGTGWTITRNEVNGVTLIGTNPNQYEAQGNIITEFCREFVAGATIPNGTGWIPTTGGFARLLPTTFQPNQSDLNPSGNQLTQIYSITGINEEGELYSFDNGVPVESVLELWANECGLTIKSNLLGINADSSNPTNQAYTFALARLQDIIVFQKTDIKNALAFQNASIAKVALEKILIQLGIFNTKWVIQNDVLCIEHVSYFEEAQGQDISALDSIRGLRSYKYNNEELPQFERFGWMDSVSPYFEGDDIIYSGFCVSKGVEKDYSVDLVTTDLNYLLAYPDSIENQGFFLLAAIQYNGGYYVDDSNKALSWTELHENLWRWNRPQLDGNMNGTDTTFETAIRLKQQEELEFRLCCDDLKQFNPSELIKTNLGWGEISKATFSAKTNCVKVDTVHESNCV